MNMERKVYIPSPIDTADVQLTPELLQLTEQLARNTHEVWAASRIQQGWTWGPERSDALRTTPCLVDYEELPEVEKDYDRDTSMETLKLILKMGWRIVPPEEK
jgi:ryanodine receptor 2